MVEQINKTTVGDKGIKEIIVLVVEKDLLKTLVNALQNT